MPFVETVRGWFSRDRFTQALEAAPTAQVAVPERSGFEYGIPPGGLTEYTQGVGQATQTDRKSQLTQLYESYLACPWAWASVNAIARTITAGGLVTDWDTDAGEGDQDEPDKPPAVLALERLLAYTNPKQDIRQVLRNVVTDLLVFGDAFIEVTWVGDLPVALWNLDAATMFPVTDDHGAVSKYVQVTDWSQRAEFEPREVIHISMDAPRSGVFGVSPTQAAVLPITAWLYAAATGKEMFRKGLPAEVHVDFPASATPADIARWTSQYAVRNLGPRNIGVPVVTKNGAKVTELQPGRVADVETYLSQKRDEIIACYGVPPAKAGVIESGNLGGGTGEAQDKTFRVNTCQPTAELILEKINFHIVKQGFGIDGWHLKFRDIDMRDSQVVEAIRDMRLRNGSWTLDKYRADIGEPAVPGGADAVLVDRQNLVLWADMGRMSEASIAAKGAPAVKAGEAPPGDEPMLPGQNDGPPGPAETLTVFGRRYANYQDRLREALRDLPGVYERAA